MSQSTHMASPTALVWGRRIRVERAARDITQADLAERAGVPQVAISRLERGARGLRPDRLARIARALDLDPAEVFPFVLDEDPALTAPRADVA